MMLANRLPGSQVIGEITQFLHTPFDLDGTGRPELYRSLRRLYRRAVWLAKDLVHASYHTIETSLYLLDSDPRWPANPIPGVRVRRVTPEDRSALRAVIQAENPDRETALARLDDALRRGFHGYLAEHGEDILGYGWFSVDGARHPQVDVFGIELGPRDAYGSDLFVAPIFRKHNLPADLIGVAIKDLRARGYEKIYCLVSDDNRGSALVHLRIGFRRINRRRAAALASLILIGRGGLHWFDKTWL